MFSKPRLPDDLAKKLLGDLKAKTLWCIHPLGHNESLACPDLWSAHHYTDVANRLWGHLTWPDGSRLYFRAVEWIGTPEQHAESLKEWPGAREYMEASRLTNEKWPGLLTA